MRNRPSFLGSLFCFWLLTVFSFCHGDDKTVEVFGIGECVDCSQYKIKHSLAFSGLHVNIDCKSENGHFKTKGIGVLDKEGKFKVSLSKEMEKDGQLKEECYAQLHSASDAPCPTHEGLKSSKIISSKSNNDGKQNFGLVGKLKFSPITCTSKFFWSHFNYPPLPNLPHSPHPPLDGFGHHHHFFTFTPPKVFSPPMSLPPPISKPKKSFPPRYVSPPIPTYKKRIPPPVSIYKKPLPPPIPKPKKSCAPPKLQDPIPRPTPFYKKPLPPPVPIYNKKPLPPPTYKPKHPFFKHLPPIFHKPLTPIFKHPFLPPIPKIHPNFPPPKI